MRGYVLTERIDGAHAKNPDYPLLPGDLMVRDPDGRFTKEAPGLAVVGFELTAEQIATARVVDFTSHGLTYVSTPATTEGDPR